MQFHILINRQSYRIQMVEYLMVWGRMGKRDNQPLIFKRLSRFLYNKGRFQDASGFVVTVLVVMMASTIPKTRLPTSLKKAKSTSFLWIKRRQ
jgi:hypothetical protein